ncbi:neurotrimin-like isoform X1 [Daphnia pulex]|uniref:neurotrimin-like isoform X1 n=2 Tax=Daphnia pulex TaxID=6669 RepID=UPI001EDD5A89|nr:neurotrimin-like isoform X1 [Daphnia pulex]
MFQTDGAGANPSSAAVGSSHSRSCCCNTKMTMSFDNMASSSDRRLLKVSNFTCRPSERRCQSAANITSKLLLLSYWTAAVAVLLLSATPALAVAKGSVVGPDPEFVEPLQNLTVTAGRDVKLQCSVKHLGSYKVAWIYMERSAILTVQNHVITRNPRISVSHDQHHTWNLHISSIQESDRGGYMCQINTAAAKTRVGYISVVVPPSIDDGLSSSDVTAREQSSVTLTCSATGTLPLTVRWRREDGKLININRTLAVTEWEGTHLDLSKVSRYDMAAYLCIASNGVPPTVSKRISLSVEFPPSVTLHQQLIGAPLGSTVSLDCTIESSPSALHFWSRSDGTDLHEAAKYLMQSSSSVGPVVTPAMAGSSQPTWPAFRTQLRLTIVNVTARDYGAYRCVAKNQYGEADGVITFHHTQSVTTSTASNRNLPPVAAISPAQLEDWSQDASNQTQMRLADPFNKGRLHENKLPDASDQKETNSKPAKSRSDGKWTFDWNLGTTAGSSSCTISSWTWVATTFILIGWTAINSVVINVKATTTFNTARRRSTW